MSTNGSPQRPTTAPARQPKRLRSRGEDEHEAGEPMVGKRQPEQERERGRGDHQQIEALRLRRERRASFPASPSSSA